ncbi:MAG: hypothetical protein WCT42_00605 [Candidatus Paceibacterota bacterium]|jgi:hypothetical protein
MKIKDIYNKYQIPEHLRQHMYRVTAVGLLVNDFLSDFVKLDKNILSTAMLLHDIGNIIKFDLNSDLLKKENIENLEKIKNDFILKYGDDEHIATLSIVKEIKVNQKVIDILDNIGSSKIQSTIDSDDWYKKVCSYSDFRVAPYGVTSIEERFNDVIKRYKGLGHILGDVEKTEQKKIDALTLESQIQEKCSSSLDLINDLKIKNIVEMLEEYEIN